MIEPGEITDAGAKTGIGVAGYAYSYFGLPLSDWVAVVTFIYFVCQIVILVPKVWGTLRGWLDKDKHDG